VASKRVPRNQLYSDSVPSLMKEWLETETGCLDEEQDPDADQQGDG
jgi:hypothetical protein